MMLCRELHHFITFLSSYKHAIVAIMQPLYVFLVRNDMYLHMNTHAGFCVEGEELNFCYRIIVKFIQCMQHIHYPVS